MKQLLVFGLVLGTTLASGFAFADQCGYVSAEQAKWAQKIVDKNDTIASLCEPCGDLAPVITKVITVENKSVHYNKLHGLFINGQNVDLAYTFVKTGENTFTNLSKMVGCPSHDVSSFLTIEGQIIFGHNE